MSGSEYCILLSNIVGEINEKVLNNNKILVSYFTHTSCLLEYALLGVGNLIKV